ncbi:hypothetical protein RM590_07155 [Streptomyces sp. DSM 44938]|uniref:Lipoprotein n=1 Tax=Streptomyces litchfieldiae TaxID=3075543 RepID=A0ABU2MMQ6_9ACTN|nr:hypothetical protein [Streptomyces sp. DSM 44938]
MFMRKSAWLRAAVPAAALTLALTACGSDDSEDGSDASGAGQSEESPASEDDAATDADAAGEGSGEEEDTETAALAAGEASEPVPYEYSDAVANLTITADRVDEGTSADLAGVEFSGDVSGMRPVYAYVTFAHTGGDTIEHGRPIHESSLTLADGSRVNPLIGGSALDVPGGCPEDSDSVDVLNEGENVTQCVPFLVPEGVAPEQLVWSFEDTELTWTLSG